MNAIRMWMLLTLAVWLCVTAVACGDGAEVARVTETSVSPPTAEVTVTPMAGSATAGVTVTARAEPPTAAPAPQATATLSHDIGNEPTHTIPTDTPMPTPTLTPEPASSGGVLDDLDKELFVGLGGGDEGFWIEPPPGEVLPAAEGQAPYYHSGELCLWGFPAGKVVNVELYDPFGQFAAARELVVDQERDGIGVVQIRLSFAGLPTGDWMVVADWVGMSLDYQFHVAEPGFPVISVTPGGLDPFDGDRMTFWWETNTYTVDEKVAIFGAGFPPDRSLPLGIYYHKVIDEAIPAELVYGQEVQADEQGSFEAHVPVETFALQEGRYYATVSLDPSYEPYPGGLDPLGAIGGFVVISSKPEPVTLELAVDGGPFVDPRVQRAVLAALNRLHLAERFGGAQVTFLFSFQGTVIDVTEEPWDPNLARQLLAEAGYANGVPVEFVIPRGEGAELSIIAATMEADLVRVGIPAKHVYVSPADMVSYVSKKLAAGEPVLSLVRR